MNLLKRKISTPYIPKSKEEVDIFYVVWHRDEMEYFLCDASEDWTRALWSDEKYEAVKFEDGPEALDVVNHLHQARPKRDGIIELKVITEQRDKPSVYPNGWVI